MIRDAADIAPSVHPRLRGELNLQLRGLFDTLGSSPLTRGTRAHRYVPIWISRFIPAYAGNSQEKECQTLKALVHPRLRGELKRLLINANEAPGSSPLTRGTPGH